MPLITCPGCHRSFKVDLSLIGTDIDCPRCDTNFSARPQRTARHTGGGGGGKKQNSGPIILAVVGVLGFIALIAFTTSGGKDDEDTSKPERTVQAATDAIDAGGSTSNIPDPMPNSGAPKGSLRERVDAYLDALKFEDVEELRRMMNFVAFHNRLAQIEGGGDYSSLVGLDVDRARQKILERVVRTEEDRTFLKRSNLDPANYTVIREDADKAEVHLIHTGLDQSTLRQERHLEFTRTGRVWMVSWEETEVYDQAERLAEAGVVSGGDDDSVGSEARTRRSRALGMVEPVEHLPDTPPALRSRYDALAAKLTDLSLTREAGQAKRELVAAGKAAIPSLLNVFVGREDLRSQEDAMICNGPNQALERITRESFGFAPSSNAGSAAGAESVEDNKDAIRSWFGWWARNKDTWTGPPLPGGEEDDG